MRTQGAQKDNRPRRIKVMTSASLKDDQQLWDEWPGSSKTVYGQHILKDENVIGEIQLN
jgi:hypothetical protein